MSAYDIKRAFNIRWFIVCAGAMLVPLLSVLDKIVEAVRNNQMLECGWTAKLVEDMLYGDAMMIVLPVICALPFAASFVDEYRHGVIRFELIRSSKKQFIWSKLWTCICSGGCMAVFGICSLMFVASIIFLPLEQSGNQEDFSMLVTAMIKVICRFFCVGAFETIIGLTVSAKLINRYMAWLAPFIVTYLLIIICERYFASCKILYPKEWLNPSESWPLQGWSVCLWLILLIVLFSWMFVKNAQIKLKGL